MRGLRDFAPGAAASSLGPGPAADGELGFAGKSRFRGARLLGELLRGVADEELELPASSLRVLFASRTGDSVSRAATRFLRTISSSASTLRRFCDWRDGVDGNEGVGCGVGCAVGRLVGAGVGSGVGAGVGCAVGRSVGCDVGCAVGSAVGWGVGSGSGVAFGWGLAVATGVGWFAGAGVGSGVGSGVGVATGSGVGVALALSMRRSISVTGGSSKGGGGALSHSTNAMA